MASREKLTLREMAVKALENSTKMLKVASELRKQGNQFEADRLRNEARTQRTVSTLLMAEASRLEQDSIMRSQRDFNTSHLPPHVRN